jgi:predicted RecA/RadA family phage recombinase
MTAEAVMDYGCPNDDSELVLAAAATAGQILQTRDGRAGFVEGLNPPVAGATGNIRHHGVVRVPKTATMVILDGGRVYWDHSANKAHFKKAGDRDFYLGTAVGEAASADTTMLVDLNRKPEYLIDINRDPFTTALVGSSTLTRRGGKHELAFDTTAEAQKIDILSDDGFAVGANAIVEARIVIVDNGDAGVEDFNVGVADATHASDADSITESVFIHIDGNALNILAESDDDTTEVAATDTTVDFVEGTEFEVWMDLSDPAGVRIFIDGVRVLSGSTFVLTGAAGPLKLLAHMEKSSNDTPGQMNINFLAARIAEQ